MISITIYKNRETYAGLHCIGHAGYDVSGRDVVCAAVSALVINTVNALDQLTTDTFAVESDEASGEINCRFDRRLSREGTLLMDSLVLGLNEIQKSYGNTYMSLTFKEV